MTTITLRLHDLLTQALHGETIHLPVAVDVTELAEFNELGECELDLDSLLREQRLIAHLWSVEDVKSRRPDLTDDQAWSVLERVASCLDHARGITLDAVEQAAYDLFGVKGASRAERCQRALDTYEEAELIDLLADAMHWCQAEASDFDAKLALARAHFEAESSKDQEASCN